MGSCALELGHDVYCGAKRQCMTQDGWSNFIRSNMCSEDFSQDTATTKLAHVAMASAAAPATADATLAPTGPNQRGRGVQGPTTLSRGTLPIRTRLFLRNCSFPMGNHIFWQGSCLGSCTVLKEEMGFILKRHKNPNKNPP